MPLLQMLILLILLITVALFLWGRWRHDMVALAALLACVFAGLVPATEAFAGFGHPAVITVACVLILSRALQDSGAVTMITRHLLPASAGRLSAIAALTLLATVLSGFMNNVGALALLMPIAIQMSGRLKLPPGKVLMPLAFGSILGGMTTLIGTPPNLIVSSFRASTGAGGFGLFDFSPVGVMVAGVGVTFLLLAGWRLVPTRQQAGVRGYDIGEYLTELRVTKASKAVGLTLRQIEARLDSFDAQIVALIRNELRLSAPSSARKAQVDDILVIEIDPKSLSAAMTAFDLALVEAPPSSKSAQDTAAPAGETTGSPVSATEPIGLGEMVVLPTSALVGNSARDLRLRTRFGLNLLGISRQGRRPTARVRTTSIRAGDVLLMQGGPEAISEFASAFGCAPLAERGLNLPNRSRALLTGAIMLLALGATGFGVTTAPVAFAAAVLMVMILRILPASEIYGAVDWPVIVLLGALMPVAGAIASTGAADQIARLLLEGVARGNAVMALAVILIVTMTISDFVNNAATAAIISPIAVGTAAKLGVNADAFLMAVAVGASCAFLTPIGHQNNTLILGPGGFRFDDYWRVGLPLEILVVLVAMPTLLWVWPL